MKMKLFSSLLLTLLALSAWAVPKNFIVGDAQLVGTTKFKNYVNDSMVAGDTLTRVYTAGGVNMDSFPAGARVATIKSGCYIRTSGGIDTLFYLDLGIGLDERK
jgi:hypothetical protein